MPNLNTLVDATPGATYERILGVQDGTLKWFIPNGSRLPIQYKTAGAITALEITGNNGPLCSSGQGDFAYTLATAWQMGFTYPATVPFLEHFFAVQTRGAGHITVNTAQYRGRVASQAAMLALIGTSLCDWCSRTDLGNQPYIRLSGTDPTQVFSWASISLTDVNRPPIDWGVVANTAAMTALTAVVGDVSAVGAQGYRLLYAPASTLANWGLIDNTVDKPKIILENANNVNVFNLPQWHSPVVYREVGSDHWSIE